MDLLYYGTISLRKKKKEKLKISTRKFDGVEENSKPSTAKNVNSSDFYHISFGERTGRDSRQYIPNSSTIEDMNKFHSLIEIDEDNIKINNSDKQNGSSWKNSTLFKDSVCAANEGYQVDHTTTAGESYYCILLHVLF